MSKTTSARTANTANTANKEESWMLQILYRLKKEVVFTETDKSFLSNRRGSPVTLFDACKAWKISPLFPKKIAVRVGKLPLWKRIVASSVIWDMMTEHCNLTANNKVYTIVGEAWASPDFHLEFWRELSRRTAAGKFNALSQTHLTRRNKKRLISLLVSNARHRDMLIKALYDGEERYDPKLLIGIKAGVLDALLEAVSTACSKDTETQLIPNIVGMVSVFGKNWPQFLDKMLRSSPTYQAGEVLEDPAGYLRELLQVDSEDSLDRLYAFDECTFWLQPKGTSHQQKGLDSFLLKWAKRPVEDLQTIASRWASLDEEVKRANSFNIILAKARILQYPKFKNFEFALESAKWSLPEEELPECERLYVEAQRVETPFSTEVRFNSSIGDYVGRFLPREDVRVGFFGHYTNCCQHWIGAGKECTVSAVRDPFSQLFVVEKEGEIIAGSWVWETHNMAASQPGYGYSGVCFDNVEAKGLSYNQNSRVLEIYRKAAMYLLNCGYGKVTVGRGESDLDIDSLEFLEHSENLTLPGAYGEGYSDAGYQSLLAEDVTRNLYALGSVKKVWVRGGAEVDDQLKAIATSCYSNSWDQEVGLPDSIKDLYCLVLMDLSKGAVGYCTLDIAERYICDLAVIEEYRTHSTTLLRETLRYMKQCGGIWSADAKEDTSLRLLKLCDKKGMLNLKVYGVSHTVDGVDCYKVEITF